METLLVVLIIGLAAGLLLRMAWRKMSGKGGDSCCGGSCGGCGEKSSCGDKS